MCWMQSAAEDESAGSAKVKELSELSTNHGCESLGSPRYGSEKAPT